MVSLGLLGALGSGCTTNDNAPIDSAPADTHEDTSGDSTGGLTDTALPDVPVACEVAEPEVVHFATEDGVRLEAAYFAANQSSRPAVVLLHMIPPSNNRGNYSRPVIDALTAGCVSVLNVDRRGAGGSEGNAREAYDGPLGVQDANAAVQFLLDQEVPPDATRIAMVGASNGTTTLVDYAAQATPPAALRAAVFLSGGTYSENQVPLTPEHFGDAPVLFLYPTGEAAWNEDHATGAPDSWTFEEVMPGAHGTRMFAPHPESLDTFVTFLEGALMARSD